MVHPALRLLAIAALAVATTLPATAQVGLQNQTWSNPAISGLLWYPTAATSQAQQLGPFAVDVALGPAPRPGRHPLVLISHGTGGNELGHAWLAQGLAAQGYVVATLRHPGDNWQDRSAVANPNYFHERPAQVSRVLDALLADARWSSLIDANRIAAIGHSAGGHTVLALAGARPDRTRVMAHCGPGGVGLREDAAMCSLGEPRTGPRAPQAATPAAAAAAPAPTGTTAAPADVRDNRIRAVVAVAPLGVALDPASLPRVALPVLLDYGVRDEVLVPRFHAEPLCRGLPQVDCQRSADAGHFALFQAGTGPLGGPGVDPAADPVGFDRVAWQAKALPRITQFLAKALK